MAARFGNKNLAEIVFVTWYRFHKDQLENDLEIFGNDNAIFKEFEKRRRFSKFVDTTNVSPILHIRNNTNILQLFSRSKVGLLFILHARKGISKLQNG